MADDVFGIVGSVIAGAYQVEAVVAEGGFGVVYRAHHIGFRATIALKCLKVPQQLGPAQEAEFLEQFRGEAELLFRLSASIPTVVRPLHVDALTAPDGRFVPFMALEWLDGETLDQIIQRRIAEGRPPLGLKKVVRLLTPVARALERAHNFVGPEGPISIVHRDLKPENIFVANVAGEEVVKVLDFGIAKAKSVASQVVGRASQTQSSLTAFTPAYGAPEQWLPKRFGQTGPWTDVYGLALTVVEVLAQRNIIDGDPAAMMGAAIDPARRPTPRSEGIEVSDAVELVFRRALAVDPRERWRDAGELWTALLAAMGESSRGAAARDARAEPGVVPRIETVESAPRTPGAVLRSGPHAHAGAETMPASALQAAAALEYWPTPARPATTPPTSEIPALDAIPDLAPVRRTPIRRSGRSSAPASRDLDFDLDPSGGLDLALDLAGDDKLASRISRPEIELTDAPVSGTARSRLSSGSHSAVGRTISGSHPIIDSVPAAAASQPPVSARPISGTSHPAVEGRIRGGSGSHPAVDAPMLAPAALPAPPPQAPREQPLGRRLLPGIILVALSVLITIADQSYAASTGEVFSLGPVRSTWIAVLSMVGGVAIIIQRVIQHQKA
jgi:eukaryotic-like serine/threonine-protein kinase